VFRPCIDLHEGKVKQIVGGTLGAAPERLQTNFVSDRPAAWYAEMYKRDGLKGGHVIMLGPGNETEGRAALRAYPGGLQIGGGVNLDNARASESLPEPSMMTCPPCRPSRWYSSAYQAAGRSET